MAVKLYLYVFIVFSSTLGLATAWYCLHQNCDEDKVCRIFYEGSHLKTACGDHHSKDALCSDVEYFPPCFCFDTTCVYDFFAVQPKFQPIETTTIGGHTDIVCISQHCHGIAFDLPQCLTSHDVEGNGCICLTDSCITNTSTEYANNPLTTQSTAIPTIETTTVTLATLGSETSLTTDNETTVTIMSTDTYVTTYKETPAFVPSTTEATFMPTTLVSETSGTIDNETTATIMSTGAFVTTYTEVPTSSFVPLTTEASLTTASTRKCHICGDQSSGMPCSSKEINNSPQTLCTSGDYCMTDVIQDAQGNRDVYKRCGDMATCEKEWIQETADHDFCKKYGTIINPGAFSCHFCCDSDGCNSNIVPDPSTWYSTQNG